MKALIKHEVRRVWGIGMALIVLALGMGIQLSMEETQHFQRYIQVAHIDDAQFLEILARSYGSYLVFACIAIILMVYFQFSEDKSTGTGDFIASLPYTQSQQYRMKALVGGGMIVSGWIVFVAMTLMIYNRANEWIRQTWQYSFMGEYLEQADSIGQVTLALLSLLGIMVLFYLILLVVQYAIYPTLGSVAIGVCSIVAVPYLMFGFATYVEQLVGRHFSYSWIETILEAIMGMINPLYNRRYIHIQGLVEDDSYIRTYVGVHSEVVVQILCMLCIGIVLYTVGELLSRQYGLRNRKTFIINKPLEVLFKIGVTVCSALIPHYMVYVGMMHIGILWLHLGMIIVGGVGYMISYQIIKKGKA